MIDRLEVRWFKSLKNISIECRRVNVFIGEPNTGKSNLVEVIGVLSHVANTRRELRNFVRFRDMTDLFFDKDTSRPIEIVAGSLSIMLKRDGSTFCIMAKTNGDWRMLREYEFDGSMRIPIPSLGSEHDILPKFEVFRMYRFRLLAKYESLGQNYLEPPDGRNLLELLLTNPRLRKVFRDVLENYGYRLVLREFEGVIEVVRELEDGTLLSLPLHVVSETLYRLLMHLAAIETSRGAVIAFEEPEIHSYPYFSRYLAERIARDPSNQYFITTHSPYVLLTLIEKTPLRELTVNIVYMENHETKIKQLTEDEIQEMLDLDYDALLNLSKFLEKARRG